MKLGERCEDDSSDITYGAIAMDDGSSTWPANCWKRCCRRILRRKLIKKRVPILKWITTYSRSDFFADLVAGLTVGVTVIPQGIAYATVAGLPPQYGLYSAFMGCFVYVILGSTQAVTIGPTALLGLMTYNGAVAMGPGAAVFLAFFAGCVELLLGLLNFGFLIEFIAAPVIAGFSTAAAFTIATTQVKSLFGLTFTSDGFVETWKAIAGHISETRPWDALMGLVSIVFLLVFRVLDRVRLGDEDNRVGWQKGVNAVCRIVSTSRNAIVILAGSVIAAILTNPQGDYPFYLTGNISAGLPPFQPPPFYIENGNETYNAQEICTNLGSALIVTPLIAILESVAIAKSFGKGQKIDASQEMIAIGVSNILGSFVSSFPVTGSFSRTAVNAASGVRTPFNGIFTGSVVLLATSVLTPYFFYIPKSCLAGVIITAVIFMVEVHLVKLVWKSSRIDLIPLFITFLCCLFLSLEYGILIGTAVNLAMLLYSTSRPRIKIQRVQSQKNDYLLIVPDRSLAFTAVDYFMSTVRKSSALYRMPAPLPIVIDLSHVSIADFSAAYGFHQLTEDLNKRGHFIVLTKTQPRVLSIILGVKPNLHVHRSGCLDDMLEEVCHLHPSISS